MKSILLCSFALASSMLISNCISVTQKDPAPRTTTTTTSERSVSMRPNGAAVETQTTQTR